MLKFKKFSYSFLLILDAIGLAASGILLWLEYTGVTGDHGLDNIKLAIASAITGSAANMLR